MRPCHQCNGKGKRFVRTSVFCIGRTEICDFCKGTGDISFLDTPVEKTKKVECSN
jgi:DnaJ-class molecular chaperone